MSLLGRLVRGAASSGKRADVYRKETKRLEYKEVREKAKQAFAEKKRNYSYGIYR